MILVLSRLDHIPRPIRGEKGAWRLWAHDAARAESGPLEDPIVVTIQPLSRMDTGMLAAGDTSLGRIVDEVIQGLAAGGLIRDRKRSIVELRLKRTQPIGRDGMIIELSDGSEPF